MFSRLTRNATLVLSAVSLGTLLLIGWPTESDFRAYRTNLQQSRAFTKTAPPVCQKRSMVCKDIWFSNEGSERLHYRIESAASSLNLQPVKSKVEVIEQLHDMRCWMQDKIVKTAGSHGANQQSRYFTANQGVYHFLSQSLVADQATLSLYRITGEHLPEIGRLPAASPFLKGNAEQIKMLVSGKTPLFQAYNFKASMNNSAE